MENDSTKIPGSICAFSTVMYVWSHIMYMYEDDTVR